MSGPRPSIPPGRKVVWMSVTGGSAPSSTDASARQAGSSAREAPTPSAASRIAIRVARSAEPRMSFAPTRLVTSQLAAEGEAGIGRREVDRHALLTAVRAAELQPVADSAAFVAALGEGRGDGLRVEAPEQHRAVRGWRTERQLRLHVEDVEADPPGDSAALGSRCSRSGSPLLTPCIADHHSCVGRSPASSSASSPAIDAGSLAPGRAASTAVWSRYDTADVRPAASGTRDKAESRRSAEPAAGVAFPWAATPPLAQATRTKTGRWPAGTRVTLSSPHASTTAPVAESHRVALRGDDPGRPTGNMTNDTVIEHGGADREVASARVPSLRRFDGSVRALRAWPSTTC